MSKHQKRHQPRKSRFEIETERRRREMVGGIATRPPIKVSHAWLRLFKPSTRRLILREGSMGGARCTL